MALNAKTLIRIFRYVAGLFIMSLGVSFSVMSDLGVSAVSAIPYVCSVIIGCDMGICTTSVFISYMIIQMCIMQKDYNKLHLFQLVPASMMGAMVSCTNRILANLDYGESYILQLLFTFCGIVLIAIGVSMYIGAGIMSLPPEGLMEIIAIKAKIPLHRSKTIFDCTVVFITIILSLIFLGRIDGVREGTILGALGVGLCIKYFNIIVEKIALCRKKPDIN